MRKLRIIPRLDIKGPNLIKGIHLEGLRVLGDPQKFAMHYYEQGADELLYLDSVASLYQRNNILDIVKKTAEGVFIPLTVGGGIRSIEDAKQALRSGADKVAINTAAVKNPGLLQDIADHFGNQCVVLSIEAKQVSENAWDVYTDNGREKTGLSVLDWVEKANNLGVGEILLTSVDQEGTKKGFDIPLFKAACEITKVPIIACGGMGSIEDIINLLQQANVDAVAIASILHYNILKLPEISKALKELELID